MFQNNSVLIKLKRKLHANIPRVEGIVKSTEKGFGFLEVDSQTSYFIPSYYMKNVIHGDKIRAKLKVEQDREIVEPEKLIESFLTQFIGQIYIKNNQFFILPDYPSIKNLIRCGSSEEKFKNTLNHTDWVTAKLIKHKLRGSMYFYAEIINFVISGKNSLAPWSVTLSRHNLDHTPPDMNQDEILKIEDDANRQDLTNYTFVTIDNNQTKDIDDALFIEQINYNNLLLIVAISDPTAYIPYGSKLDIIASERVFTNYLPGLNIPMLPRKLSEDICSLHPKSRRPVVACRIIIDQKGSIIQGEDFFLAWIESKAKLSYENVSDWLENVGHWIPENNKIVEQLHLLSSLCARRISWRKNNALIFKDRPEFKFHFSEDNEILDIVLDTKRIAHKIVEESMILANICAAKFLSKKLGFGVYNIHMGFDNINKDQINKLLSNNGIKINFDELSSLEGFCKLRRILDNSPNDYINYKIKKLQSFVELSSIPKPHFLLGLPEYATWTSPIRKYGDMINHRLLKSIINNTKAVRPSNSTLLKISDKKRRIRMAERDILDWLYVLFFKKSEFINKIFSAEVIDVFRGGLRVKLIENGANAFVPAPFLHNIRNELICNKEHGVVYIKNKIFYRISDIISVKIVDIRITSRSIVVQPVTHLVHN